MTDAVRAMAEALAWYADPANWWTPNVGDHGYHNTNMGGSMERARAQPGAFFRPNENSAEHFHVDCGSRAKTALAAFRASDTGGGIPRLPEDQRLTGYPDYLDDPEGLERFRTMEGTGHAMAHINLNSLRRLVETIDRLKAALSTSSPIQARAALEATKLWLLTVPEPGTYGCTTLLRQVDAALSPAPAPRPDPSWLHFLPSDIDWLADHGRKMGPGVGAQAIERLLVALAHVSPTPIRATGEGSASLELEFRAMSRRGNKSSLQASGDLRKRAEAWWREKRMGGTLVGVTVTSDGRVRFHWDQTDDCGTYALAINKLLDPSPEELIAAVIKRLESEGQFIAADAVRDVASSPLRGEGS